MSNKVVDTSISAIKLITECCKISEMCERVADTFPFVFYLVPDWYQTQEM